MTTVDKDAHTRLCKKIYEAMTKIESGWEILHSYDHQSILMHKETHLRIAIRHARDSTNNKLYIYYDTPRGADDRYISFDSWLYTAQMKHKGIIESIKVSAIKEPETIAKDIMRRLVVQIRPLAEIIAKELACERINIESKNKAYRKVCELMNAPYRFSLDCEHELTHVQVFPKNEDLEPYTVNIRQSYNHRKDDNLINDFKYELKVYYIPFEKLTEIVEILKK